MSSSRSKVDPRRRKYLSLAGQVGSQLRDAYARKYELCHVNQAELARKLGIDRSSVHNRLKGHTNMTLETLADMVWALDHEIEVKIYDPAKSRAFGNYHVMDPLEARTTTLTKPLSDDTSPAAEIETGRVEFLGSNHP